MHPRTEGLEGPVGVTAEWLLRAVLTGTSQAASLDQNQAALVTMALLKALVTE